MLGAGGCLDYALGDSSLEGVWGGMADVERRELLAPVASRSTVRVEAGLAATGARRGRGRNRAAPRRPTSAICAHGEPACEALPRGAAGQGHRGRRERAQSAA